MIKRKDKKVNQLEKLQARKQRMRRARTKRRPGHSMRTTSLPIRCAGTQTKLAAVCSDPNLAS